MRMHCNVEHVLIDYMLNAYRLQNKEDRAFSESAENGGDAGSGYHSVL